MYEPDSSVSIASDYGLDDRDSIPGSGKELFFNLRVEIPPTFYPVGKGVPFAGGKLLPGRDADHSPPSTAAVKNE
jgi:hypothetical protein